MTRPPFAGIDGNGRSTDGASRQFEPSSTDPRHVVAMALAEREGWAEIRPMHWATAGVIVKALRTRGLLVDRRKARTTAPKE